MDKKERLAAAKLKTRLPQGMTEFHAWAEDILDLYELPNNISTKFALANTILHAAPDAAYESKEWFGLRMLKFASNQVAAAIAHEFKAQQEEARREEQKRQQAEATAQQQAVASDGQKTT